MSWPASEPSPADPERARPSCRRNVDCFSRVLGMNGSAAYADIDSGVAVAVMRNRFTAGDLTTVARIDRVVAQTLR